MTTPHEFVHHVAAESGFEGGLRGYFEYRDLGIAGESAGDVVAHVIRAREGDNATGQWHRHLCTFQMYYVLRGWARFEYEGHGVHTVRPGDCVLQPPGIRHREIDHSEDFELIEIVAPADFRTEVVDPPA
jgi:quercetin dioxygenase-like cupin family protein